MPELLLIQLPLVNQGHLLRQPLPVMPDRRLIQDRPLMRQLQEMRALRQIQDQRVTRLLPATRDRLQTRVRLVMQRHLVSQERQ